MEQEIIGSIIDNDVVLIAGDTGCGKSTQVPQFLYENGFAAFGEICVTQPRRVAAISICQRVGEELNNPRLCGYQVRYDKSHFHKGETKMKFLSLLKSLLQNLAIFTSLVLID